MRLRQKFLLFLSCLALPVPVLLAVTIVSGTSTSCEAAEKPKRVLMLHSFGPRFKPWTDYAQAIRSEINQHSQNSVEFLEHSLVNAGQSQEKSDDAFVEYLSAVYTDYPLDLIVALGAPAASFVQRHRQRLFPRVPMVVTAVDRRRIKNENLTDNDAVVSVTNDVPVLFENIMRVLPDTKTIAIVNGASPIERFWTEEMRRELEPLTGRVDLKWYNELPFDHILEEAAHLPPHSAIFLVLMNVDAAGITQETGNALSKLSSSASAPIFSFDDSFFGEAIVGGPMLSVLEGSRITAAVAMRILGGEKAGNIKTKPIEFAPPKFDWRQMQRWGVSESSLPPESNVYFRPPNAWETYRWQILTACTVVLLQGAFIALLLFERHRRHSAEVTSNQRLMELAHVNRFSTAGELAASIAHEINQPLGSILTNTETAKLIIDSPSPDLAEVKEILADIWRDNQRASEVIRRLRRYVSKAPFEGRELDLNDLVTEVVKFLSAQARFHEIRLQSQLTSAPLRINGDPIQLQQVLSNLILNAMDALSNTTTVERSITIATIQDRGFAKISITDNGPGIPPESAKKIFDPFFSTKTHGMGMGLSISRAIVAAHKGDLDVESQNGAVFQIRLPMIA